jgi:FixJ family two-component response regulator
MPGRPLKIAIVDDDASVRKALARLLSISSFIPTTYSSAQEFLTSLESGAPECLVLDLRMPGRDGLQLHDQLRRSGVRIPTIIMTGHNESGLCERCCKAGAAAFLVKPFEPSSLIEAIAIATNPKDGAA